MNTFQKEQNAHNEDARRDAEANNLPDFLNESITEDIMEVVEAFRMDQRMALEKGHGGYWFIDINGTGLKYPYRNVERARLDYNSLVELRKVVKFTDHMDRISRYTDEVMGSLSSLHRAVNNTDGYRGRAEYPFYQHFGRGQIEDFMNQLSDLSHIAQQEAKSKYEEL